MRLVAEHDLDAFVRRAAEDSLNIIRGRIKEWAEKPPKIDVKMRERKGREKELEMRIKKGLDEDRLQTIRRPVLEY